METENNKTELLVISRIYILWKFFWINHTYTWYGLCLGNKEQPQILLKSKKIYYKFIFHDRPKQCILDYESLRKTVRSLCFSTIINNKLFTGETKQPVYFSEQHIEQKSD